MFCAGSTPHGQEAVLASLALVLSLTPVARAHEAPKGWKYPYSCCSGYDCREVTAKTIAERPEGYIIAGTGEIVGYHDARLRESPDGDYHWCSVAGASDSRTICLFVPPRSY
ncbi:hypothetical protein GA830_12600 [Mesorhizobium sp. NBSH29]|uniref:hypothetical protein n=1 Tax=Mesorhizobium sp. NBSH29 TaxID=2654249 RepID=UPI0018969E56|nr:hypothetical protein [Mesorhizobium sp. NBSH29]QPC87492.1 hypothetical protein GA830_12600 [Mesorhizobium sp. NBSH29]